VKLTAILFLRAFAIVAVIGTALPAHAQQTLAERDLKRIVERERILFDAARADPMGDNRDNIQMQVQEVVQDYERVIRENPEFAPAFVAYGLLLNRVGERRRSAEIFLRANKLDPSIAVVKNQLGNYCAEEGEFQDAMEYYLAAIALEPGEALYHYQLGTLLHEYRDQFILAGRLDAATVRRQSADAFKRAVELAPDSVPYAYRQAESYYDLAEPDWPAAINAWQKLETRVSPGIERQTIELHIANILVKQEKFDEARAVLTGVTDPSLKENRETLVARMPQTP
jgi:tetratricopeptide (TPR) repeat protein